jgi:LysM repeat protein
MINELILAGASFFHPPVMLDSIGTETINGKVFILHQVGEKETLYAISRRYGTTIELILQYNPGANSGLEIGQVLKVPYVPRKESTSVAGEGIHTVAAKETMFSISQAYNVSIDDLKKWNNLTTTSLSIGQQIYVRKPGAGSQPAATPTTTSAKGIHVVGAKETMFSISRQYGVSVQQLREWNRLESNDISIGQELFVAPPKDNVVRNQSPVTESVKTEAPKPEPAEVRTTTPPVVAEVKKETPPAPVATPKTETREQTIRISESVKNSDEVLQTGLAELIEGTEGNRKYLALHKTAPVGTILKVKNEMNNREVFVRVMGKLPDTSMTDKLVIKVSKSAYDRLGAIDQRFRVEVTYYK